jgi:hypothetical protein
MENFEFFIDRKFTMWERERHSVEAETFEEAKA